MKRERRRKHMTEDELNAIIRQYDVNQIKLSDAYGDDWLDYLWPRFHRAAINQIEDGEVTLSRYAIWADTVRDNAQLAHKLIDEDKLEEAKLLLIRVINSLSAFSDVQRKMDPRDW
jgi:hypothetical protein